VPRGQNSGVRLAINYLSFILSASFLGPFALRGQKFDVVLVYAPSPLLKSLAAMFLAWLKRARLVVWVQDLWPESLRATGHVRNLFVLGIVGQLVRAIYRSAQLVLVQSRAFVPAVAAYCDLPEKIRYYPNLYRKPTEAQPNVQTIALVEQLKASFAVVLAGNIGTAQDPETILATAHALQGDPDIRLVIVGSGSQSQWLADQASQRSLDNLVFAGQFAPSDMPHIFAAASALMITLAADPALALTVPSRLQAYLAAGRPIVGALDGEASRIIAEAGAGVCVPAGAGEALAAAIRDLAFLPQGEQAALGSNGREYYDRNFEPLRLTDDLVAHLQDAIALREGAK
jgi:glycosyltransferase involved in cell wall biosynthesis